MNYRPEWRPAAFSLVNTWHGGLIIPVNDRWGDVLGVGGELVANGAYDPDMVEATNDVLRRRRERYGDGVVALDVGANIGIYTVEWARTMASWGAVLAFEPQRWLFNALCGNLAIHSLFNADARHAAVGREVGTAMVPRVDYTRSSTYGGLSLSDPGKDIGQPLDGGVAVPMTTVDSFGLHRVDLIKIDVEGMECAVLDGAVATIMRCKPIILAEWTIVGKDALANALTPAGYHLLEMGVMLLAIHTSEVDEWHSKG